MVPIGRGTTPDIGYGLSGSVSYKNLDISFLLQGATHFNNLRYWALRGPLPWNRNSWKEFLDCWHHEDLYDINSPWVPGKYPAASTRGTPPSNQYDSEFWMDDPTYLRLKHLEIGYDFTKMVPRLGVERFRVYFSSVNLFTWTSMSVTDPESLADYAYPMSRDFTFGLSVTF